jgi:hypothetical protein
MYLLLRQHPRKYLSPLHDPVEQGAVVVANHAERIAVARKHVIALLNGLDEVGLKSENVQKAILRDQRVKSFAYIMIILIVYYQVRRSRLLV